VIYANVLGAAGQGFASADDRERGKSFHFWPDRLKIIVLRTNRPKRNTPHT
jgi:hypothetical protein